MTRGRIYSGHRFRVTFNRETEKIAEGLVGKGKRFSRHSDLVNYSILQMFGSEVVKKKDQQSRIQGELADLLEQLQKLEKKNDRASARALVLSAFYGVPVDDPVSLSERVVKDWDEHWNSASRKAEWVFDCKGKCDALSPRGQAKMRLQLLDSGSKQFPLSLVRVELQSKGAVLQELLLASKILQIQNEVEQLKDELRNVAVTH